MEKTRRNLRPERGCCPGEVSVFIGAVKMTWIFTRACVTPDDINRFAGLVEGKIYGRPSFFSSNPGGVMHLFP